LASHQRLFGIDLALFVYTKSAQQLLLRRKRAD